MEDKPEKEVAKNGSTKHPQNRYDNYCQVNNYIISALENLTVGFKLCICISVIVSTIRLITGYHN